MEFEFIKTCEAIKILEISREKLRTKYVEMKIERTQNKPYWYRQSDCVRYRNERTQISIVPCAYLQMRLERLRKTNEKRL